MAELCKGETAYIFNPLVVLVLFLRELDLLTEVSEDEVAFEDNEEERLILNSKG